MPDEWPNTAQNYINNGVMITGKYLVDKWKGKMGVATLKAVMFPGVLKGC
jgi:hypothetical protein